MRSVIIGAGTYGEVYLAYLLEDGVEIVGFLDDDSNLHGTFVRGVPVLGGINMLENIKKTHRIEAVYCPLGNNKLRVEIMTHALELGYKIPNFIHHSVNIAPNVEIANKGVYILSGTTIMPWCKICDFVMMSVNTIVSHHSNLEEGVFLSFGVNLGASITVHKYAYLGISSTIMTGVHQLGENCMIGAGAVVIKDVPENAVMAGVPAKILKYR